MMFEFFDGLFLGFAIGMIGGGSLGALAIVLVQRSDERRGS